MEELDTRLVPYDGREMAYARNRPPDERTPIAAVGDTVWYRRDFWERHPVTGAHVAPLRVTVVWVQDLDDREDPNLWHQVKDLHGLPLLDAGVPRCARVADPWPLVRVRGVWDDDGRPDAKGSVEREATTREARVRGSAGWLPLDYRSRPVRLPHEFILQPLAPLNVPPLQRKG